MAAAGSGEGQVISEDLAMKTALYMTLPLALLAACGGGGSSEGLNVQAPRDRAQAFIDGADAFDAAPGVASLPSSGSASYNGQLVVAYESAGLATEGVALGDMNMNVSFGSGNVSGSVTDLFAGENGVIRDIDGSLDIDGRTIGTGMIFDATGQVNVNGQQTSDVRLPFSGDFRGSGATPERVGGTLDGGPILIPGTNLLIVEGAFQGQN